MFYTTFPTLGCYISIVFSNCNSNYAYSRLFTPIHVLIINPETWEKILNAGKIRQHIVAEVKVDSDSGLPSSFWYHRKCHQYFTLKRILQQLKSKQLEIHETIAVATNKINEESTKERPKRGQASIILIKECLFCKKIKQNKDKTKQPLSLRIDKPAEESIKSAATNKGDFALLGLPDMIAAEVRYHRTCYRQYLKVNYKNQRPSSSYSDAENEAYK